MINLEEDGVLTPVAASESLSKEDMRPLSVDRGIVGETYRSQDAAIVDDLNAHDAAEHDPAYESALSVPIGRFGVFQVVAESENHFDETDQDLAELLVSHTESALGILTREQQLEAQNEQLEEFASIVSHDLQSPLNVAQGRVKLAREECASDHLDDVASALERSQALIDDLLTLAKHGDKIGTTDPVDLSTIVDTCWQTVETDDASLVVDTDKTIMGDQTRLKELFVNLISNAIEHGSDEVTVTIESIEDGFVVEDDGPGIPADERSDVFESGYSTAENGTGFGLTIVEQIATAHGWGVSLAEGSDGGARFEFSGVDTPSE